MTLAKTFMAIGIAVIFAAFICYGVSVIYESPKGHSYTSSNVCATSYPCQNQFESCNQLNHSSSNSVECRKNVLESGEYKQCSENLSKCRNDAQKKTPQYFYSRNIFYILIILGILSIILGMFLLKFEGIGSGFIGGGVLIVLWAVASTYSYWVYFNKWVKLSALGLVLIVLIYLGYKKIENKKEK